MLQSPSSPVPSISISFAPNETPVVEPKSPFFVSLLPPEEPDSPRPQHLLPPPSLSPNQLLHKERLSPLNPAAQSDGKGIERTKFEAMLKMSRERGERGPLVGSKRAVDLRRELAVKAQVTKQMERRARFLYKLAEPPSPSAADVPVTPPESPAIFHFSLPSPGLESPIEMFEGINSHPELYHTSTRIEQVDFRLPRQKKAAVDAALRSHAALYGRPASTLPSLDQISQRMNKNHVTISTFRSPGLEQESARSNRLPSFLQTRSPSPNPPERIDTVQGQTGRTPGLVLPELVLYDKVAPITDTILKVPPHMEAKKDMFPVFPPTPKSPHKLQVITTICPPTSSRSSPTEFTEENVTEFATSVGHRKTSVPAVAKLSMVNNNAIPPSTTRRAEITKALFNKLSRRTTPGLPGAAAKGIKAQDDNTTSPADSVSSEEKLRRRISAPAEVSAIPRGERHPILDKPGGF